MKFLLISLILISSLLTTNIYAESEDCIDAKDNAESVLSDLEYKIKRLHRCVQYQYGEHTDDCYSEFRKVKSLHSDYESSVSDVSSYCD